MSGRRRALLGLLGVATVAWATVSAQQQQPLRIATIGDFGMNNDAERRCVCEYASPHRMQEAAESSPPLATTAGTA